MKKPLLKTISYILVMIALFSLAPLSASAASSGSSAGTVSVSSGSLYVRGSASTSGTILTALPQGSYLTLISKSGSWWRVEYAEGKYGYCYASYITQVSGAYSAYATGSLNVRSGASTSYSVIGWLSAGEYIVVLSSSGTWKKVLYEGDNIGYASGKYLSSDSSTISLNVPSYKQTDSRWASTQVGVSGRTIGDIGCSTVALAMSESYRTGTTIYPDDMEARLSYTSGGAVYWPSNYTAYAGSDYLSFIYSLLKSGKPVLVGSKNSYGGQHWVVVTGFNGGPLSASSLSINDPGSVSRTTLQQFFAAYPYFYKLMYY
jgi:uncharacterized protein YraI